MGKGNALISPTIIRKAKLISSYGFLIAILYIVITYKMDTRIIHFELRDIESARYIYNIKFNENHIGKYLYKAYDFLLTDYLINKVLQGFLFFFFISYWIIMKITIKDGVKFLRGSKLIKDTELSKIARKKGQRHRLTISKAKIPLPFYDENRGIALYGKPGSGKTQALLNLILQIKELEETMIIYDRKPDFWIRFYRKDKDYLFYPDELRTLKWNIFDDISDDIGYKINEIDLAVKSFIPDRTDNKDPFWDNASRLILKAILLKIKDSKKPSNKSLINFIRKFQTREELYEQLKDIETEYGVPIKELLTEAAKTTGGAIMMNLQPYYEKILKNEFFYEEGNFSIKEFINKTINKSIDQRLFLVQTKREDGQYSAYFRLMIDIMIREILSLPNSQTRRIWTLLDEFQTLGKLHEIIEYVTEGRSKGGSSCLATQSLAQVREIYGENHMETLFQALSTKIIHKYDEPRGSKMLRDYFGEQEVEERTSNRMVTSEGSRDIEQKQTKITTKKVLLEGEFANLDPYNLEAYIKISDFDSAKISFKYQDIQPIHKFMRGPFNHFNLPVSNPIKKEKETKEQQVVKEEEKKEEIQNVAMVQDQIGNQEELSELAMLNKIAQEGVDYER